MVPGTATAQREPVLKQIALPHNYYYREMYLPQATSGPSSVAWLPDGKSLIYSMQGSLWRQRIGDSTAEQLTSGPGYAYQPDCSPDGSRVVFARYDGNQMSLEVLDLTTLVSTPLVADGAVNVEPRWSPDGSRIAYVSTAFEGRFHVFVVPVPTAQPPNRLIAPSPTRLTDDHDSGLPRYYYSRYDHYLSPTWSPDGRELILVSNRGKIWGTGGMWRMEAKPGAEPRPVHDEETTWRMRPDWALDGRRVVYASYLGRPWHQLWLTTADGGDPVPLTFGDFDATDPRWSPDGRRIAYISNEGGNTSLRVLEIPGGRRIRVEALRRNYRERMTPLRVVVTDGATGKPLPARVSVTGADGRSFAPDDAWRHADDAFDRKERALEVGYFHTAGTSTLMVPSGIVTVEVTHGPDYRVDRRRVRAEGNAPVPLTVRLPRLLALPGWTAGDLHVHMNYGGHYRATPATLAFQARAEGLNVVENLIVNKEDRIPDVGYFTGKPDPVSTPDLLLLHDQEFHTSWWGHGGVLGLTDHLLLPDYSGYAGTPVQSLFPDNATVADEVHAQHGLFGYVHPFDSDPDPADTTTPLTNELPVDVALGKVDYYEVVGFSDHLATARVWFRLLNCGFRLPAGAGTDAMTNYASLRGPVGMNRVYVQSPVPLDRARWYAALRAGKSFATNGPLVQLSIGQVGIGGDLTLPEGSHRLHVKVALRSNVAIDHLELVGNGVPVARIPLPADRTSLDTTVTLDVSRSSWFVLRAYSDRAIEPVLDIYPYGSTSPIYVTVGGKPVRSRADAEYFLRWLDRLEAAATAHQGWNTTEEKREVLGRIQEARAEFERRR
jgi:Tol biopolymer transport system component